MAVSPARSPSCCLSVSISQLLFLFINRATVIVPSDRPGATLTINKRLFSLCVGRAKKKKKKTRNGEEMGRGEEERRAEEEKGKKGCLLTRQTNKGRGGGEGVVAKEQSLIWTVGSPSLDWRGLGGRGQG